MKLSDYARQQGVRYETAWRWFRDGRIKGRRVGKHTILIEEEDQERTSQQKVAIYARVSSTENTSNLKSQAERLAAYCTAKGYQMAKIVKEIGSGVNESRPKFLALLEDQSITLIVVEHKDRGTRFGYRYIETLLRGQRRSIEVVNQAENGTEDLLADLISIISSFCARLYGQRRAKRKTEKIVAELEKGGICLSILFRQYLKQHFATGLLNHLSLE
jgi:predicted site-specific integrase-resolvase